MLADISCDRGNWFDALCRAISPHDPTGIGGAAVERLLASIAIFIAVWAGGFVLRRLILGTMRRAGADPQVRTLARNLIAVTTYVVAALSALVVAGVNVALLVTAAGVGTVAIGFAFQDVLRNLLAGIWLLLEQPFRLGDVIAVEEQSGTVQNITLRTTTLRSADGRLVVMPNLTVFSSAIVNTSRYDVRRCTVGVRLPPGTDLGVALRDAREGVRSVEAVAKSPEPALRPQLDGEAMIIDCVFWVDQRAHDPDVVTAQVAERVWNAGQSGAKAGAPASS